LQRAADEALHQVNGADAAAPNVFQHRVRSNPSAQGWSANWRSLKTVHVRRKEDGHRPAPDLGIGTPFGENALALRLGRHLGQMKQGLQQFPVL
jgi:hypothetical protein